MTARVGDLELVVLGELFARLHSEHHPLAVFVQNAPGALVQRKTRRDEIGVFRREVFGSVECAGGFLAASERHFDGTRGAIAVL